MNKRFLVLAGLATVLSVGTYVVLNKVKPYKHEEPKVADVTSPDQVFGASIDNPEAHADEAAAAPAADGAASSDDLAAVQPTDTAVQPAGSVAASAPTAAADDGGSVAPLVPAGESAAAPESAPTTETASAPVSEPEPETAPAAEPAPAVEEPAPAPAPVAKPKPAKKAVAKTAKSESSSKTWWPAENPNKLSVVYAGPASYKQAVVVMFNGAFFKPDSVNANIKVTDKAGKAVAGNWELGTNNLRMVVFPVSSAGTYKVSIAPGLTDNKGRKFGSKLSGSVVVK